MKADLERVRPEEWRCKDIFVRVNVRSIIPSFSWMIMSFLVGGLVSQSSGKRLGGLFW